MNYFLACSFIIRYRCSLNKGNRFAFLLYWWLFHKLYRWAVSERCFWWSESQSQSSHLCLRHYKWKAKSQTDKHSKRNKAHSVLTMLATFRFNLIITSICKVYFIKNVLIALSNDGNMTVCICTKSFNGLFQSCSILLCIKVCFGLDGSSLSTLKSTDTFTCQHLFCSFM